jgi:hypothetical protein
MAAAPMYVQQRVVGVLSLASRDPHAFDRWAGQAGSCRGAERGVKRRPGGCGSGGAEGGETALAAGCTPR